MATLHCSNFERPILGQLTPRACSFQLRIQKMINKYNMLFDSA